MFDLYYLLTVVTLVHLASRGVAGRADPRLEDECEDSHGICGKKHYYGYKVFTIFPLTTAQDEFVEHLWLNDTSMMLDFWKPPSLLRKTVDIMVAPESLEAFEAAMEEHNITTSIMMEDVGLAIDKEQEVIKFGASFLRDDRSKLGINSFRLDRYHSYTEIQQWLHRVSLKYPHIVEYIQLRNETNLNTAQTIEGRTIDMVKIGYKKPDGSRKPSFWIDGGIHAREWAAPSVVLYIINELLEKKDIDPKIDQYLAEIDWYLLPVANPDGYEYSRNFDRMWRKNRRPPSRGSRRAACWGVDLNRNFDWNWGGKGASHDNCKETYHGLYAFSEHESKAIQYQVRLIRNTLGGFITLHSYSQIWMYPYGHDYNKRPRDWKDLLRVARKATDTLKSYYGKSFTVDTGANALYPASGGSDDWAKGKMNIKYVYLVELRPEDEADVPARKRGAHFGFLLPESQILPTCQETWGGIQVVADAILRRNKVNPQAGVIVTPPPTPKPCEDQRTDCQYYKDNQLCYTIEDLCAFTCEICR